MNSRQFSKSALPSGLGFESADLIESCHNNFLIRIEESQTLKELDVRPLAVSVAKTLLERHHYLHSLPGGTYLSLGVFLGAGLVGAVTFGVGSFNAHKLVERAKREDYTTLTRLWLSDHLPRNSESRVLGITLKSLRRYTNLRFVITYADPTQGHVGTIYQATNFLYIGLSEAMPRYNLGDGVLRHSRSLSHSFGTHSTSHFRRHGVDIKLIPQAAKHRYIYFIDPSWQPRLRVAVLPYPKKHEVTRNEM